MDKYSNYNDNEIIYLIRSGNEEAYMFLVEKYSRMIYSRIIQMRLTDIEDCYQEGLIALYDSIKTYNISFNKSFNKYFELVLKNRLLDIKRKKDSEYEYILNDVLVNNVIAIKESSDYDRLIDIKKVPYILDDLEKEIFKLYYVENHTIKEVSNMMKLHDSYVYSIICEIKNKIKKYMVK